MYANTQNMTGFGGYGEYPSDNYANDYSQTNAQLHTKYHNMNQTEVPQMKFATRQGNLNLKIVKNIDLNYIIKTNNISPLEKISHYLIFSDIKESDFEDKNIPRLLKTFQYVLEYLNEKQGKLVVTNKKLDIEYNQLINQSYEIEEKLKINKNQIAKNSQEKKERENMLITYESIVNFNSNPIEKIDIITKNITRNYQGGYSTMNMGSYPELQGKFYCHICNGKFFNTESRLESHMKKRHLAQMRNNLKLEREKKREEQIQEEYDKKIEDTKNFFQTKFQQRNEVFSNAKLEDEINMMKRDNKEKMNNLLQNTKNIQEQMTNMFQTYMKQLVDQNNTNMMNLANAKSNNERENNEPQKIIIENPNANNINALTNSIAQLTDMMKQQKNNYFEEENAILKNKLEILENQTKMLKTGNNQYESNYNYNNNNNYYNNNNNKNPNNNINSPKINNSNENNDNSNVNDYQNKNINNINNNKNITNINTINTIVSDKAQNDNDYNNNKVFQNKKDIYNNYNDSLNLIFNQGQNKQKEINIQREKRPENDNQDPNLNNKNEINNILSGTINNDTNNQNSNTKFSNTADNFNNKVINIYREESPNKNDNNFNKTAPNALKKRTFKPLQPKIDPLASSTMRELDTFYAKFMNRDQPIIEKDKASLNDYLKEDLIPPEKQKDEQKINEDMEKTVKEKMKQEHLKPLEDFENKDKKDLLEIIGKTMENINEINSKSEVRKLYFETAQKAIDLKLIEEDFKLMKNAYDSKGELKRSRSSSRAKIVIQQAENEKFDD